MSGASERANGRAGGPVLQSVFLAVFDHSDVKEVNGTKRPKRSLDNLSYERVDRDPRKRVFAVVARAPEFVVVVVVFSFDEFSFDD